MKPLRYGPDRRLRFSAVDVVSCVLVVAGLALGATVDMAWMILFALGAFGPPALRAVGILADRDEFQRGVAMRASHHAYIAGGLFLSGAVVAKTWGTTALDHDAFSASLALAVLVVVYFLSYVTGFWGARAAAFRVLLAFGCFWLAFTVLSHPGIEALFEAPVGLVFVALAFASWRWPRISGILLVGVAILAFFLFRLQRVFHGDQGAWAVLLLLLVPLLAMGIALLAERREGSEPAS